MNKILVSFLERETESAMPHHPSFLTKMFAFTNDFFDINIKMAGSCALCFLAQKRDQNLALFVDFQNITIISILLVH